MGEKTLHANVPRVVHETIDGEVIVIDLATGTYFSLQGGAADVWALLGTGRSTADIVSTLAEAYREDPDSIRSELEPFVAELESESLVVVAESDPGLVPNGVPDLRAAGPFSVRLEKHTDMTELILLDPVHDVDSVGWPHLPDGSTK